MISTSTQNVVVNITNSLTFSTTSGTNLDANSPYSSVLNILPGAIFTINTAPSTFYVIDLTINNFGQIFMNTSGIIFSQGIHQTQIWNNYGTVSMISPSVSVFDNYGSAYFYNFGIVEVNQTFANESAVMSIAFYNSGIVRVNNGMFYLNGGGSHNGTFIHNSGSQIIFSAGTNTLTTLSTVENGTGIVFLGKNLFEKENKIPFFVEIMFSPKKTRRNNQYLWNFYAQFLYNDWINDHFLHSIQLKLRIKCHFR